uniref:Lysosomal membrane ascorbate-dependent ferrireductase CYB561A3 n=1 Tax=Lepisosteus oculatus TaxID=7918 RepID=W5NEG0_LEPOC
SLSFFLFPPRWCTMSSVLSFYVSYLLCLCLGFLCVVFVSYWNSKWRGGFAWDGSGLQFNWHPVLMVTGLVVVYGNAAVLYRIPLTWGENKLPWKLLHAVLMFLALLLAVLGLCAVFDFHNKQSTPNLYSVHSWVGICTVVLFATQQQWALGLCTFLLPCSPLDLRKFVKPLHVWMGSAIFIMGIISCISGINEKLIFSLKSGNKTQPYSTLPPEAVFANSLGILIVAFGVVVLGILSKQSWRRPESGPEDDSSRPLLREERQ